MITKTTMVVIFNSQNSHLLTLSLPTEEVFQVNGQNRPVANLTVVDFHSAVRNASTKATEYATIGFSFVRNSFLTLVVLLSRFFIHSYYSRY